MGAARDGRNVRPAGARPGLLVLAAYVALTAWWLWPLPLRLADRSDLPAARRRR